MYPLLRMPTEEKVLKSKTEDSTLAYYCSGSDECVEYAFNVGE